MTQSTMTSLQRVLTTLGQSEPDRVPFFLLLTLHGAKELNMSIQEYFSKPENVVEGQLRLREKYNDDCYYTFYYAGIEIEAMGGSVIYTNDGPPNAGTPIIKDFDQIDLLEPVSVLNSPQLNKVLTTTQKLKDKVGDDAPIIGVVMSPFSLPIMQLGFGSYIELMYENPKQFWKLMDYNQKFCVEWANAQLDSGATAICYFDPCSSPSIVPVNKFIETGFEIGKKTISQINGPVAIHLASGASLPIANELTQIGAAIVGVSIDENLSDLKAKYQGKINILGNLNALEMRRWTKQMAEDNVKDAIKKAANGGGFILSDNHGEIPYQVSDEVLMSISNAVHRYGKYPIDL